MAKQTFYFPHDGNARNDEKILALRMKHKMEGYGVYFAILEKLLESSNYMCVKDYNVIAFDLRVGAELIKSIVEKFGLFKFTEDGEFFYSESFNARMKPLENLREQRRLAGKKSAEKRAEMNDSSTTVQRPLTKNSTEESKVKKSKEEKEIDKEKPNRFSSPTQTEVIDFFMGMENLKPSEAEEAANRFYSHHSKNKWSGVEDWHELAKNFKNDFKGEFGVVKPKANNQSSDENKPPKTNKNNKIKRFTPPSTLQVFEYLTKERNLSLPDAEYWTSRFEDFYTSNGWKVGKNPMKDWKAAARNCVLNWDDKRQKSGYIHPAASHTGSNSDSILSKFNKK